MSGGGIPGDIAAVQAFVKELLQGLVSPPYPAAQAWITPLPISDAMTAPQLFIATPERSERRLSSPRGTLEAPAGAKVATHTVRITALAVWTNTDPANDTSFVNLVGSIMSTLRSTAMPAQLADPITNQPMQLSNLGEDIDLFTDIVRAVANQQLYRWYAELTTTCKVAFQS